MAGRVQLLAVRNICRHDRFRSKMFGSVEAERERKGIPRPKNPHPKATGKGGGKGARNPVQTEGSPPDRSRRLSLLFLRGAWGTACLDSCLRVKGRSCGRLRSNRDPLRQKAKRQLKPTHIKHKRPTSLPLGTGPEAPSPMEK